MAETTTKIEETVALAVQKSRDIAVSNDKQLADAGMFLRGLKTVMSQINATFDGPIKAAHTAHREIIAAKKKHADPVQLAERAVKSRISVYQTEQDRIRHEEERKRRIEEEERQRKARVEEERRLAEAAKLEDAGKAAAAEAVIDAPVEPPPAALAPIKPLTKVEGVSVRTTWKWRVTNDSLVPRRHLIVDDKSVSRIVRVRKGDTDIPGIEVFEEKVVAATGL